jgi:hypothetical protein
VQSAGADEILDEDFVAKGRPFRELTEEEVAALKEN